MSLPIGFLILALATSPEPEPEPIALCRPKISGEVRLARAEAIVTTAKTFKGRFFDYGYVCDTPREAATGAEANHLHFGIQTTTVC